MSCASKEEPRQALGIPDWIVDALLEPGRPIRRLLDLISALVLPIEVVIVFLMYKLPARLRNLVCNVAWRLWLALHRVLPRRIAQRGPSDSLSLEAHAMYNISWWLRLFPVTLRRIRCALAQVESSYPASPGLRCESVDVPEEGVRGYYLHTAPVNAEATDGGPRRVLMWFYGGAYLGGSAWTNRGLAERYARMLDADAFLVDYRLCPEHLISDAFQDGCRAYAWLLRRVPASRVVVFGVSSGGAVALRVLQLAVAANAAAAKAHSAAKAPVSAPDVAKETSTGNQAMSANVDPLSLFFADRKDIRHLPQPVAAVLCGPFIRYTTPTPQMLFNARFDIVCTPRLFDLMLPMMGDMCGGEELRGPTSPLEHSMDGLCPLLVSTSEHEVCYAENMDLVAKVRAAGGSVELKTRPFFYHVYVLFACFIPEAREAEAEMVAYMNARLQASAST